MKMYLLLRLHIKITCQRYCIVAQITFWDIRTRDIWNGCLQTYRNNRICYKVAYCLRKIHISRVNYSRIVLGLGMRHSGYCFMWTRTDSEIFKSALVYF